MQSIKNQTAKGVLQSVAVVIVVTACGPPGPRAVLEGKRLLDRGEAARAIEELRTATQLLPTNALAFNYLGLACQQAGQVAEAERAYLRALTLDHDLTEIHYDLGCLWLNQSNKLEQAKAELTTYTLRRPNATEGWVRLGEAQLRSRELNAAERSLGEALRLSPQSPEALTAMGLARYQRKHANEAAQCFVRALKQQPNYGPALLNLAIVAQQDLNDPRLALQKYREYLALTPERQNAHAVSALVRQLEQELNPVSPEPATNVAHTTIQTNILKSAQPELARSATQLKPSATNAIRAPLPAKAEPPTNVAKTAIPTNAPKPAVGSNSAPAQNVETVKLSPEPVFRPAEDTASVPLPTPTPDVAAPVEQPVSRPARTEAIPQKRGFFQRINPINLFAHGGKPSSHSVVQRTTSVGSPTVEQADVVTGSNEPVSEGQARMFARYTYRSPDKPGPGDRVAAERSFAQGVQEQQARRLPQAIQAYRRAAQLDPSFFDAHYNLGLAASESGNLALALAAYETALATQPESLDARYNFGLVLKQAGYVLDAVSELEKILASYPNDSRAHLALGNLYAQQLQQPAKARPHYLAVLATAPQSPQAGAIRYWLSDHPR